MEILQMLICAKTRTVQVKLEKLRTFMASLIGIDINNYSVSHGTFFFCFHPIGSQHIKHDKRTRIGSTFLNLEFFIPYKNVNKIAYFHYYMVPQLKKTQSKETG